MTTDPKRLANFIRETDEFFGAGLGGDETRLFKEEWEEILRPCLTDWLSAMEESDKIIKGNQ